MSHRLSPGDLLILKKTAFRFGQDLVNAICRALSDRLPNPRILIKHTVVDDKHVVLAEIWGSDWKIRITVPADAEKTRCLVLTCSDQKTPDLIRAPELNQTVIRTIVDKCDDYADRIQRPDTKPVYPDISSLDNLGVVRIPAPVEPYEPVDKI